MRRTKSVLRTVKGESNMEQTLQKLLNLGIGTAKTIDYNSQEFRANFTARLNEWIAAGEIAQDENSLKIKSALETGFVNYRELQDNLQELVDNISEMFEQVTAVDQPAKALR